MFVSVFMCQFLEPCLLNRPGYALPSSKWACPMRVTSAQFKHRMPGPNSTNLFSWTQWSNQNPAGRQELGPQKHNAMAQNQMWHMSELEVCACALIHTLQLKLILADTGSWPYQSSHQFPLADTEMNVQSMTLVCAVIFDMFTNGFAFFSLFYHRRKESIAWFSEEMRNCRSRSFTPISARERMPNKENCWSDVGISTSNCCIQNKGHGGWKQMTHGKKAKNYKEEYWRLCVWNSGSLKHKEKWQESWIWAQICMDAVCTLNKLVFRNKCISVFKHKPYAIEVLALC